METLCADEIVAVVRSAWDRAIGGMVDSLCLDCACENVAADFLESGIPESSEQAKARMEPMLLDCGEVGKLLHKIYHEYMSNLVWVLESEGCQTWDKLNILSTL